MLAVKKESSCFLAHTLPGLVNAVIHKHRVTDALRLLENMLPADVYLIPPRIGQYCVRAPPEKLKKLQLYTGEESRAHGRRHWSSRRWLTRTRSVKAGTPLLLLLLLLLQSPTEHTAQTARGRLSTKQEGGKCGWVWWCKSCPIIVNHNRTSWGMNRNG